MLKLYTMLVYCLLPFLVFRNFFKYKKSLAYLNSDFTGRWKERLGIYSDENRRFLINQRPIWIHTVSVGEFIALLPLIKLLRNKHPEIQLLITCTTLTGSDRIIESLGEDVLHVFIPWDTPLFIKRFYQHFKPRCGLIMETEIWPNVLNVARQMQLPLYLINARLSNKSARGYQRFSNFSKKTFNQFQKICVQNKSDGERFINLGLEHSKLVTLGNIKFDLEIDYQSIHNSDLNREKLDWKEQFIILASSTHTEEEKIILQVFLKLKVAYQHCVLIIVPRHPERFSEVQNLLDSKNLNYVLRTEIDQINTQIDVLLGNSMGEMMSYYALSDLVIMGGSLVNHGGHNILEPAALAKAILTGPFMFNFTEIVNLFIQKNALIKLSSVSELDSSLFKLVNDAELLKALGDNALNIIKKNGGTKEKIYQILWQENLLN